MKQYFVGVDGKFALDLSSDMLKNGKDVGATFMSSMFNHCTSVPIWIDGDDKIHLLGPVDMYNFAWGSKGAERDISALKHADIVVFPAVQEFIYFADAMHPRDVEKSQAEIRKTYEHLNNKHIILITQDRGVDEKMIMQYTFENQVKPKSFQTIDEMDFTMCLQGLKTHYINSSFRFPCDKNTDFVYWGSDKSKTAGGEKSGDSRLNIIKSIEF